MNTFIVYRSSQPWLVWIRWSIGTALAHIYRRGIGGWTMKRIR